MGKHSKPSIAPRIARAFAGFATALAVSGAALVAIASPAAAEEAVVTASEGEVVCHVGSDTTSFTIDVTVEPEGSVAPEDSRLVVDVVEGEDGSLNWRADYSVQEILDDGGSFVSVFISEEASIRFRLADASDLDASLNDPDSVPWQEFTAVNFCWGVTVPDVSVSSHLSEDGAVQVDFTTDSTLEGLEGRMRIDYTEGGNHSDVVFPLNADGHHEFDGFDPAQGLTLTLSVYHWTGTHVLFQLEFIVEPYPAGDPVDPGEPGDPGDDSKEEKKAAKEAAKEAKKADKEAEKEAKKADKGKAVSDDPSGVENEPEPEPTPEPQSAVAAATEDDEEEADDPEDDSEEDDPGDNN